MEGGAMEAAQLPPPAAPAPNRQPHGQLEQLPSRRVRLSVSGVGEVVRSFKSQASRARRAVQASPARRQAGMHAWWQAGCALPCTPSHWPSPHTHM